MSFDYMGQRFGKRSKLLSPAKKTGFLACYGCFVLWRWWLCFAVLYLEGDPLDRRVGCRSQLFFLSPISPAVLLIQQPVNRKQQ